jgi:hypothetical protein
MVPSLALISSTDSEHLSHSGFSLGETVRHGSFEFITDYFGGLSLSPRRSDKDTVFMGSTRIGPSSPRWAMIEDSIKEFHMASSGGGGSSLPSPKKLSAGAIPAPIITTPWQEDAPVIQSMTTFPPWVLVPQPDTDHSFERWHTPQEGQ